MSKRSPREIAEIRLRCLEIAARTHSAAYQTSLVDRAKELEVYVVGGQSEEATPTTDTTATSATASHAGNP